MLDQSSLSINNIEEYFAIRLQSFLANRISRKTILHGWMDGWMDGWMGGRWWLSARSNCSDWAPAVRKALYTVHCLLTVVSRYTWTNWPTYDNRVLSPTVQLCQTSRQDTLSPVCFRIAVQRSSPLSRHDLCVRRFMRRRLIGNNAHHIARPVPGLSDPTWPGAARDTND